MLEFRHVTLTMKDTGRCLVRDFNFVLNGGDKAAIIGEEGDGKSTLLKFAHDPALIAPYCDAQGEVYKGGARTAYLQQECPQQVKEQPISALFGDLEDWSSLYINAGGLGVDVDLFFSDRPLGTLSGGENLKLRLLYLLAQQPDVLLLDEPTNDIDLPTLEWMERLILSLRQPVLYVSHDETLLERTAGTIVHLEQVRRKTLPRWTVERTGYASYVARRLAALEKQEQIARKEQSEHQAKEERWQQIYNKVNHQLSTISRQDPHGGRLLKKKMASVKAQGRRIEKEGQNLTQIPDVEDAVDFLFEEVTLPRGKRILELDLPELKIQGRLLARQVSLSVTGPVHVGITGANGVGKSTLLRYLAKELVPRKDIRTGVMPQNYEEILSGGVTPVQLLAPDGDKASLTQARTYLGCMRYTHEEMTRPASELSGGQKAKLLILSLILGRYNVLLLDEPTRNFSPLSNPVLRQALDQYGGAWLAVTHDRKLLEICHEVYELGENGLTRVR
ncbi:MAG TPA: ABC-F family ATP-binding cassette domain-containing protein [Candidatus Gallacutalibacter stercoravium]|nr:ABC-F family ATP-binding cassette domain-containing protein [Candidatus Gallacutalibacter stercoravium]